MVTPSWGSFQKPQPREEESQSEEMISEGGLDVQKNDRPKPQWGNFQSPSTYQGEIDPTEEESTIGYLVRNLTQSASRIGEQFIGARGNVEKMGRDVLTNYPQAGGLLSWGLSELLGPEKWEKAVKGVDGKSQIFPTSENIKEISQKATGGYTKPKTPGEEKVQGVIEDIGSTIRGRPSSLRNAAVNNLGIPLAANAVKETVSGLGFGEDKAMIAKLGVWTGLTLLGNVNAPQYASQLTNQGRNGIPETANFDIPRLQQRLTALSNDPHLLNADPRSALARQKIADIQRDLANGQTSLRSLMTTYDGVNASKRDAGLFQLSRGDQRFARGAIDRVRDTVRDEILDAGGSFPEAVRNWQSGIQAWAVIHQSNGMKSWIESIAKGPYAKALTGPAAALFGLGSYGALQHPAIAATTTALGAGVNKAYQTAYRVWNNENLSRYYWNAISAAQSENIPAFVNNYHKLNKGLKESKSVPVKVKAKTKKD
jgi:hypothetical protein